MLDIKELKIEGYERVIEAQDPEVGLHAFIAIHSTALGPSLGGVRMFPYPNRNEALLDVLRLSRAMSYKSALAETGLGGGKCVLIADADKEKTTELFLKLAEVINYLHGDYIAAEDVGTSPEDIQLLKYKTPYVCALPSKESSGDPSRFTAFGVFRGIQAAAYHLWNSNNLKNKVIALQGLGHVGTRLAEFLFWNGAELIVSDLHTEEMALKATELGATIVSPEEILQVPCDIFAPCALGGVLTKQSIEKLKCEAIAGAANNQLASDDAGELLYKKGILYAPDYVINSGGIINASCEFEPQGYNSRRALAQTSQIYERLLTIFDRSKKEGKPTNTIADEIAEYKLLHKVGKRIVRN